MNKILFKVHILFLSVLLVAPVYAASPTEKDCVVVLHGMGRTKLSMKPIERSLVGSGYVVWNETYPSTSEKIEKLSIEHIKKGIQYCELKRTNNIHFVTHSLGGIMVRYYLQDNQINSLGRIVMLSPPNKGSEVSDYLQDFSLYKWATGPAGQQLGTTSNSLPNSLKRIHSTVGVITGEGSLDPWFSIIIPGKDDGKVSVESAKLEEMTDFLVVSSGHTFIMKNDEVIHQVRYFLEKGKFNAKI